MRSAVPYTIYQSMAKPVLDFSHLSLAERIQLAEDLWDSLDDAPEALELTPAQRAELDRRLEEHRLHPEAAIPWEQVRADLFKRGG